MSCQCFKSDGSPCTRLASRKIDHDQLYCWQHQGCVKSMATPVNFAEKISISMKPKTKISIPMKPKTKISIPMKTKNEIQIKINHEIPAKPANFISQENLYPTVICMNISHVKGKAEKENKKNYLLEGIQSGEIVYIGRSQTGNGVWNAKLKELQKTIPTIFDWQNPYSVKTLGSVELALEKYREYILNNGDLLDRLPELYGKQLACWCVKKGDEPCHGNILRELVIQNLS
jgi:hypothetical protein